MKLLKSLLVIVISVLLIFPPYLVSSLFAYDKPIPIQDGSDQTIPASEESYSSPQEAYDSADSDQEQAQDQQDQQAQADAAVTAAAAPDATNSDTDTTAKSKTATGTTTGTDTTTDPIPQGQELESTFTTADSTAATGTTTGTDTTVTSTPAVGAPTGTDTNAYLTAAAPTTADTTNSATASTPTGKTINLNGGTTLAEQSDGTYKDDAGNKWISSGTDQYMQVGFPTGTEVDLQDGTKLTSTVAYEINSDGTFKAGVKFTDQNENKWATIATDSGVSFQQTSYKANSQVKLNDGTVLTNIDAYELKDDGSLPAGVKFTDQDGNKWITTTDGKFSQKSFAANSKVTLTDGTVLTNVDAYELKDDGSLPAGVKFTDQDGNKWATFATDTGVNFQQTSYKAGAQIKLEGDTVLTNTDAFELTADGKFPAGVKFTDQNGNKWATFATDTGVNFQQTSYKAGAQIKLEGDTVLTATDTFELTADGKFPAGVKFTDQNGNKWASTSTGGLQQTSYKAGSQIKLEDGTTLTNTDAFELTTDGKFPAGVKFTDQNGGSWTTTAAGGLQQTGYPAGAKITLADGTVLTSTDTQPFSLNADGTFPEAVQLPDRNVGFWTDDKGNDWRVIGGQFVQLSFEKGHQITLQDGTVITSQTAYRIDMSTRKLTGVQFTDSLGRTWTPNDAGGFTSTGFYGTITEQVRNTIFTKNSYQAGDKITLKDGTVVTSLSAFTVNPDGTASTGIQIGSTITTKNGTVLTSTDTQPITLNADGTLQSWAQLPDRNFGFWTDDKGNEWRTVGGQVQQISWGKGYQITQADGTVLTSQNGFRVNLNTGQLDAGAGPLFTDQKGQLWSTYDNGTLGLKSDVDAYKTAYAAAQTAASKVTCFAIKEISSGGERNMNFAWIGTPVSPDYPDGYPATFTVIGVGSGTLINVYGGGRADTATFLAKDDATGAQTMQQALTFAFAGVSIPADAPTTNVGYKVALSVLTDYAHNNPAVIQTAHTFDYAKLLPETMQHYEINFSGNSSIGNQIDDANGLPLFNPDTHILNPQYAMLPADNWSALKNGSSPSDGLVSGPNLTAQMQALDNKGGQWSSNIVNHGGINAGLLTPKEVIGPTLLTQIWQPANKQIGSIAEKINALNIVLPPTDSVFWKTQDLSETAIQTVQDLQKTQQALQQAWQQQLAGQRLFGYRTSK